MAPSRSARTSGTTSRRATTTSTPSTPPTVVRPGPSSASRSPARAPSGPRRSGTLQVRWRRDDVPLPLRHRRRRQRGRRVPRRHHDEVLGRHRRRRRRVGATAGGRRTGWKRSTGTETTNSARYYLLENRQYVGFDKTLDEGPYQFSEAFDRPNWVEFFKFQDGMLVWLVDQGYTDNNVSRRTAGARATPCPWTRRPNSLTYPDGTSPSNRREPFDATFGLDAVDVTCLHKQVAGRQEGAAPSSWRRAPAAGRPAAARRSTTPTRWSTTTPPRRRTRSRWPGPA